MEIYAKGKNISSFPFCNLFTQGEKLADTITFFVERFYGGTDLYGCSFLMRGVNENGEEAQQALVPETNGELLRLEWRVSEYFTAVSGKLELELRAVRETDGETGLVLIYAIPPITVRPSRSGENLPLPDVTEQAVNNIADAAAEGMTNIQQLIDSFDIAAVERRLDRIEQDTAVFLARPEVIPVTQREYDSISHKKNALYVIIKE